MTPKNYHEYFNKTVGAVSVRSHGGGHPRVVSISERSGVLRLSVDQAKDLHYMLTRFIDRHGDE